MKLVNNPMKLVNNPKSLTNNIMTVNANLGQLLDQPFRLIQAVKVDCDGSLCNRVDYGNVISIYLMKCEKVQT